MKHLLKLLDCSTEEIIGLLDLADVYKRQGTDCATAWGCDLTYDYVKINGDYRT